MKQGLKMRNFRTFTNDPTGDDPASTDYIGAKNINNFLGELENAVTRSGQSVTTDDGTDDSNKSQLAESLFLNGTKAQHFQDGGSANVIELTPVSGASGVKLPSSYANMDGAHITFFAAASNTGATTLNLGQTSGTLIGAKAVVREDGSALTSGDIDTTIENEVLYDLGNDRFVLVRGAGTQTTDTGGLIQTVRTQTGVAATGTTQMPNDDTTPQSSEGDEYMTVTITPTNSANKLLVRSQFNGARSTSSQVTAAIFKNSDTDALAASGVNITISDEPLSVYVEHELTAGTTSPITFKIRAGGDNSGTTYFNSRSTGTKWGGVSASFLSVEERSV